MEDYNVYADEEGEVFAQRTKKSGWWEDCGDGSCAVQKGYMVTSCSWAVELQDVLASRAETFHSGLQTRLSSTSVSL